jgi:predicted secreted protein
MSGQAAYVKKLEVSADGGTTWRKLPATSPSLEIGGDVLDDTEMATNAGYRSRIHGLSDFSVSADSIFKPLVGGDGSADIASGAKGLDIIRVAKLTRTTIKIRYLPTGSVDANGLQGNVIVESYNHSGDVGGLETVSISLQGNGALTATA